MKKNPMKCDPGMTEMLLLRFPDRTIVRGPITFLGPFSDQEVNETRTLLGLRRERPYKGPRYRDGDYFALVKLGEDPDELQKIFAKFLEEREIKC